MPELPALDDDERPVFDLYLRKLQALPGGLTDCLPTKDYISAFYSALRWENRAAEQAR